MDHTTQRKPGRPPEDRLLRQREIFMAVAPIILAEGARAVTMRRAAAAACLSVGALYHYFPTRRALLLHGAQPEATIRLCEDFFRDREPYETAANAWSMAACFVDFQLDEVRMVRPALKAALELGADEFTGIVEAGIHRGTREFVIALRRVLPDAGERDLEGLSRTIRQLEVAHMLDPERSEDELRTALRALLGVSFRRLQRGSNRANRPPGSTRPRDRKGAVATTGR
jgi:AcrR family transcriptional regulator